MVKRKDDTVDLLTYHEGEPVDIAHLNLHRIRAPKFIAGIRPGISLKKVICDCIMLVTAICMVLKNRKEQYDLIHAVEESVFMALIIKALFGIPYIYDMDSSLTLQITDKWPLLRPLLSVMELFEKVAVKFSLAVVPVCDALAVIANRHGSTDTHILRDVSLLDENSKISQSENLRNELSISNDGLILLYIGNLEPYQGIDLLIDSFAEISDKNSTAHLVIIGGAPEHILFYKNKVAGLCLEKRIHLTGPKPVSHLSKYLLQADILVSPRTLGNNTPMKIYSYLHSGKAILATELPTHTQVLNSEVSILAAANLKDFSHGMLNIIQDNGLRETLGKNAYRLATEEYTFEVFSERLNSLYDRVDRKLMANTVLS